jgi:putative transcriptional regulator
MNNAMTDTIKHHLTDDILMAYSAGSLPEAFNLMVASHISLCDTCRAQAESFDAVGGALLDQDASPLNDVQMDAASLAATFAMIDAAPYEPRAKNIRVKGVLPAPVQD